MMSRLVTCVALATTVFATACAQEPSTVVLAQATTTTQPNASAGFTAPDSAWRDLNQDDLLYIETEHGLIVVEVASDIAPLHAAQIKTLARQQFYDYITFHRVIDGFMNQTGDPTGTGMGDSDLPNIPAEFTFRRDPAMSVSLLGKRAASANNPNNAVDVGFYKSFPIATQPASQAMLTKDGKVEAWGLHCPGATSMARSQDPNSGNSQFFLMRTKLASDPSPVSHLDTQYSVWGATVWGLEHVDKIKVGTKGEVEGWVPDQMEKVRLGSQLPEAEQLKLQILKTDGQDFARFIATQKTPSGDYKDICSIKLPTRLK